MRGEGRGRSEDPDPRLTELEGIGAKAHDVEGQERACET